ncbi:MAG: FecR domain-containing protein [Nitrospinae bacterium]|nr:FecR domain-containing protein [Nitrospinota bacterium]
MKTNFQFSIFNFQFKVTLFSCLLLLASCFFLFSYAYAKIEVKTDTAVVSSLEGKAEYKKKDETKWSPLKKDEILKEGDEVKTLEKARLELTLSDKSMMRFAESSSFIITQLKSQKGEKGGATNVKLLFGKFYGNVSKFAKKDSEFKVETKVAVAGVRGTIYRVDMEKDNSYLTRVYEGKIEVANPPYEIPKPLAVGGPQPVPGPSRVEGPKQVTLDEWIEIIGALQQFTIAPDGTRKKEKFSLEEDMKLDWVKWNMERDKLVER